MPKLTEEMDLRHKPPGVPAWLAVCLGCVGKLELTPRRYSDQKTKMPLAEPLSPRPRKPPTDWRKIPLMNDYDLLKKVGKGGFSDIWLSEHKLTRELVVIKVVQLTFTDLEPDEVATLVAEAKFLRTLDCPYLVKCRAATRTKDWLLLVLEYCSGGEMLDHLHKVMKYTEAEAAKLFAQVVSAISYLHNLNLMHRDLKPENVMLVRPVEECEAQGRPLRVKVIDLGMAVLYDPKKETIGCVGTPGFVAPEVWNNKPQTFAMDVYSLGAMLFIMLTGRKPHSGADIRQMDYCHKSICEAPGLKDERFLSLSSSARELLLAMLADDPRDRPSCAEVLRHPFITAVDTNAEAHREIEASVRRRMRDLHRIRRLRGLRYAVHAPRPQGASQQAFLDVLEQRWRRLNGELIPGRESCSGIDGETLGSFLPPSSLCGSYTNMRSSGLDTTTTTKTTTSSNPSNCGSSSKGLRAGSGRPSVDDGPSAVHQSDNRGGGGPSNCIASSGTSSRGRGADLDKWALLSELPGMRHSVTMPPRRYEAAFHHPQLSPVPSYDPSMCSTLEEHLVLPRNWSAYPVLYEIRKDEQLQEGLAAGPEPAVSRVSGQEQLPEAPLSTQHECEREQLQATLAQTQAQSARGSTGGGGGG